MENLNEKTIIVTGGAGFIGINFIEFILRARPACKIICMDSLTYAANTSRLRELVRDNTKLSFCKVDITDRENVYSAFNIHKPNIVVNFAAESHVDNSISNPEIFTKTNILGAQILMDACLKYNVNRFHQVSTDEVYGDLPYRSKNKFKETDKLNPSSPYAASKASADLLALAYSRTFGLRVTISRCSNNFGPYQHQEKLIPKIINKALNNSKLPIYGTGQNIRDWIYVEDHCRGILRILECGKSGEVYNLGANNEQSNIDVVRIILRELGKPESLIEFIEDRPGHDQRYAIDCQKACAELMWEAQSDFEANLKSTINFYKNLKNKGEQYESY